MTTDNGNTETVESLEQEAQALNAELALEMTKSAADVAGLLDPTPTSDAISGAISLQQGEYFDAFLSGLSMIPYLGDAVAKPIKGLRLTKKILAIKEKLAAVIKKRDALKEAAEKAKKAEEVAEKAKKLPKDKAKKTTEECTKVQTPKRLKPNDTYAKNGYMYKTDSQGRIVEVSGKLRLDKTKRNKSAQRNIGVNDGRKEGDAGGHLIGSQFGGAGSKDNLVPMNQAKVNAYPNGEFGKLESKWSKELEKGNSVEVKIEPIYNLGNNSSRPDGFKVTEKIIDSKTGRVKKTNYPISNH